MEGTIRRILTDIENISDTSLQQTSSNDVTPTNSESTGTPTFTSPLQHHHRVIRELMSTPGWQGETPQPPEELLTQSGPAQNTRAQTQRETMARQLSGAWRNLAAAFSPSQRRQPPPEETKEETSEEAKEEDNNENPPNNSDFQGDQH